MEGRTTGSLFWPCTALVTAVASEAPFAVGNGDTEKGGGAGGKKPGFGGLLVPSSATFMAALF